MPIEWEFESWKEVMAHQLLERSKKEIVPKINLTML